VLEIVGWKLRSMVVQSPSGIPLCFRNTFRESTPQGKRL
jgi:hypothetical protein